MSGAGTPVQLPATGLHPIQAAYLLALLCSVLALAGMSYWITTRASTRRLRAVLPVHNAAILWALVAAVELLVGDPALSRWLVYLRTALAYLTAVLFVRFGTVYSGRSTSLRRPFNALYVTGMAVGLFGLVTQPWLGLHFDPLAYATEPFPYYRTGIGPLWGFGFLWTYVGMAGSLYYLIELFLTSKHRSSRPLVVYSVGIVLGLVPSAATVVGSVPTLPGYDHTVLGLSIVSAGSFLGAWLGMVRISPISRNRLLETTGDGLVVADDEGVVVDYNDEARQFLTGADPVGSPLAEAAPALADALGGPVAETDGDSDASATIGDARSASSASHGRAVESGTVELDRDGRRYSVVVSPVTDGGTVAGSALLIREVTERVETRRELRRQNQQLDEFASGVAHHLRNPLQVAAGQAELADAAIDERAPADVDTARLKDLQAALDRMGAIITDLRTLAAQGKSVDSTDAVPFGEVVRTAWSHVDTRSAALSIETDGTIQADRSRLLSVLENLIRNSVEHASTDGRRSADEGEAPDLTVTTGLTDDGFVFADDGRGIEADHDRLFDYGYTTSSDGTGLGLRIVETMVESHGWSIRLDPDHDGARFVVSDAVTAVGAVQATAAGDKQ